jgi:putative nucleotidyltransferase with HDIG domain
MKRLPTIFAIHDRPELAKDVLRNLANRAKIRSVQLSKGHIGDIGSADLVVVDVDLEDDAVIAALRSKILDRLPKRQPVIVLTTATQQRRVTDAALLERTHFALRPLDANRFVESVDYLLASNRNWKADERAEQQERLAALAPQHRAALSAGDEALSSIFAFARGEEQIRPAEILAQGAVIVDSLAGQDLSHWIKAVREHHDGTYQHCMLVTGVAIAFGQLMHIPQTDLKRLALATLLHDVGKASVPASILDKPGPLTDGEMKIMRDHPVTGAALIAGTPDIDPIVVDVVRHHHEYLDGSGYPDGLKGQEIDDLVRITTIADVFAALVEKRSYKPPMSGMQAHEILVSMGAKLDQPLVRVMRAIARDF